MKTESNQIPLHRFTPEEKETIEFIQALLRNGGKIIEGNQWVNDPKKGGYFKIQIQLGDQLYTFESPIALSIPFGQPES